MLGFGGLDEGGKANKYERTGSPCLLEIKENRLTTLEISLKTVKPDGISKIVAL